MGTNTGCKFSVLFVCLGNICRSPAAEGVLRSVLKRRGLLEVVYVDSAGTADYHIGKPADSRMMKSGVRRRHEFTHRARQLTEQDLVNFDLILVMDRSNLEAVRLLTADQELLQKVHLFLPYCKVTGCEEVPDPYYGDVEGFEQVLDLLEEGCDKLADELAVTIDFSRME